MLCAPQTSTQLVSDRTKILIPSSLILGLAVQSRRQDTMWVPTGLHWNPDLSAYRPRDLASLNLLCQLQNDHNGSSLRRLG